MGATIEAEVWNKPIFVKLWGRLETYRSYLAVFLSKIDNCDARMLSKKSKPGRKTSGIHPIYSERPDTNIDRGSWQVVQQLARYKFVFLNIWLLVRTSKASSRFVISRHRWCNEDGITASGNDSKNLSNVVAKARRIRQSDVCGGKENSSPVSKH